MSSYVIYTVARCYEYAGLTHRGIVGRGLREIRVCDSSAQLHHPPKKHFKIVNDAFTMHITRILQGGIHQQLSLDAQEFVKKHGAWFIQFPKFTYIRVQRCPSPPYMLPRYPRDRMVLLGVTRQLAICAKALRHKHGNGIPTPISLGNSIEVCPNFQVVEGAKKELSLYSFVPFASRDNFDPHSHVEETVRKKYKHVSQVEDFWMNAQDDMEIKEKMHS